MNVISEIGVISWGGWSRVVQIIVLLLGKNKSSWEISGNLILLIAHNSGILGMRCFQASQNPNSLSKFILLYDCLNLFYYTDWAQFLAFVWWKTKNHDKASVNDGFNPNIRWMQLCRFSFDGVFSLDREK